MDKASLDLLNKKIEKQSKFVLDLKKGIGKVIVGQDELHPGCDQPGPLGAGDWRWRRRWRPSGFRNRLPVHWRAG